MNTKSENVFEFPNAPHTGAMKITIEVPFPPIRNKVIRKLRPALRFLALHRPGNVTLNLKEMTPRSTYAYLLAMIDGFTKMNYSPAEAAGLNIGMPTISGFGNK